jgi:kynureninase
MNPLARHYTRFRVAERLLLTGHSHQAWPDVALDGQLEAFEDAAREVDAKWGRALAKAERVREGFRALLADAGGEIALGANTHELALRFLSALDLRARRRVITTDGEFHTLRRQLARLGEGWLDVEVVPARPVETLADRLADRVDERTAAALVSAVLFEDGRIVPGLAELAAACARRGAELLVDAYHALGAMPFPIRAAGLGEAWVVGGGYKYLQLGEGNCFLRVPPHARALRPAITGWFAEFEALAAPARPGAVPYAPGAAAFAGATYDPTSHYRAARVLAFFVEQALTPDALRASYRRQIDLLARRFDALGVDDRLVTRDRATPLERFGGFLALESPRAAELQRALAARGVLVDSRGRHLRLGPAPYLSDDQLDATIGYLGEVVRALAAHGPGR